MNVSIFFLFLPPISILTIQVYCPRKCQPLPMPRGNLTDHLAHCPLAVVRCHHGGAFCGDILRSDLATHEEACLHRVQPCPQCRQPVRALDADAHNCVAALLAVIDTLTAERATVAALEARVQALQTQVETSAVELAAAAVREANCRAHHGDRPRELKHVRKKTCIHTRKMSCFFDMLSGSHAATRKSWRRRPSVSTLCGLL